MFEINIWDLVKSYLKNIYIVLIVCAVTVLSGLLYINYIQKPMYRSSTTLVLATGNATQGITQNDVILNQRLVNTYREIIQSNTIMQRVITELGLNYELAQLTRMVGVSSVRDTEIIMISVSSTDARNAAIIADKIAAVFMEEIVQIYNIENVRVIDSANLATTPYNINNSWHMLISLLVGLALGLAIVFARIYFDTTTKSEKQIEALGLAVIGSVPKIKAKKGVII